MTQLKKGELVKKIGSKKTLFYQKNSICTNCSGNGYNHYRALYPNEYENVPCEICEGSGKVVIETIINIFPKK